MNKPKKKSYKDVWGISKREDYFWGGIAIIILMFCILTFYYTPSDRQEIVSVYNACTSSVGFLGYEVQVGSYAQKILNAEDLCRSAYRHLVFLEYSYWGYILGIICILYSFFVPKDA